MLNSRSLNHIKYSINSTCCLNDGYVVACRSFCFGSKYLFPLQPVNCFNSVMQHMFWEIRCGIVLLQIAKSGKQLRLDKITSIAIHEKCTDGGQLG
jgi:hypothetical protein